MHAVLNPASARPNAARRPAPPAPLQVRASGLKFGTYIIAALYSHDDGIVFVFNERVVS